MRDLRGFQIHWQEFLQDKYRNLYRLLGHKVDSCTKVLILVEIDLDQYFAVIYPLELNDRETNDFEESVDQKSKVMVSTRDQWERVPRFSNFKRTNQRRKK